MTTVYACGTRVRSSISYEAFFKECRLIVTGEHGIDSLIFNIGELREVWLPPNAGELVVSHPPIEYVEEADRTRLGKIFQLSPKDLEYVSFHIKRISDPVAHARRVFERMAG